MDRSEDTYWDNFSRETALRMDYLSGSAFSACAMDGNSPDRRVLRLKQALRTLAILKAGAPTKRTTEIHKRMRRYAGYLWNKGEYNLADAVSCINLGYYDAAMLSVAKEISRLPFGPETDPTPEPEDHTAIEDSDPPLDESADPTPGDGGKTDNPLDHPGDGGYTPACGGEPT